MRVIRKSRLHFQEGQSDKVYEVDLCDLGASAGDARYIVNFRYGRRGRRLREGTKTVSPVGEAEAREIFDSIVVSKLNGGYVETEGAADQPPGGGAAAATAAGASKAIDILLSRAAAASAADPHTARLVWRLGELRLRAAAGHVAALAGAGDGMLDYCVAWALGRCGDPTALDTLERLWKAHGASPAGLIAREAYLEHAAPDTAAPHLEAVQSALPDRLRDAVAAGDETAAAESLAAALALTTPDTPAVLEALYLLARTRPAARAALVATLPWMDLGPNTFKGARRIFKHAEYRDDAPVFGILARRFDLVAPTLRRAAGHVYVERDGRTRGTAAAKGIARPDARVACTLATRDYLRRRVWRTLRRLGERDDDGYVAMASGVLLALSDADAQPERTVVSYAYRNEQWETVRHRYDPWSSHLAFNHILHQRSPSHRLTPRRSFWSRTEHAGDPGRTEAFPELWDRHPEMLLELLESSDCEPVHDFAARALADNAAFLEALDLEQIERLLARSYASTGGLGLRIARDRLAADASQPRLVAALIGAFLPQARSLAQDWINAHLPVAWADRAILFALATTPHEDVRAWATPVLAASRLPEAEHRDFVARLLAWLLGRPADESIEQIEGVATLVVSRFGATLASVSTAVLADLLEHPAASVRLVGGRLFAARGLDHDDESIRLLGLLLEDADPAVRAVGVAALATLPDDTLLAHADLVAGLAVADAVEVRQAAEALVARLAARQPAFGECLARSLVDRLFRAEPSEGFHDDVLALLGGALEPFTRGFDSALAWRALMARSRGAQGLGASLLPRIAPAELSVRQLARLADHPFAAVRRYALAALRDDPPRAKASPVDTLRILDTSWDDTREAAFDWLREAFGAEEWTAELIVGVCDSPREDVQRFGRELVTTWFTDDDGPHYLVRLAEHPTPAVQLFVSGMLAQHAAGRPDRVTALMPYFASVLSRVNAGRAAKHRVTAFLREQALGSESAAREIAPLVTRLAATPLVADRGALVTLLRDIGARFPGVDPGLRVMAPERRASRFGSA